MPRSALRLARTPVGLVTVDRPPVETSRLVLEPAARDQVEAFLAGDFRSVKCGDGWPRESAEAGFPPWELSLKLDVEVNWLVTLDGLTIGDCFTQAAPTMEATSKSATALPRRTAAAATEPSSSPGSPAG